MLIERFPVKKKNPLYRLPQKIIKIELDKHVESCLFFDDAFTHIARRQAALYFVPSLTRSLTAETSRPMEY
jgi:hypothetical protein